MKVGILGGTFNPPHIGHILLGHYALENLSLDKLIYIPTANPVHKTIASGWNAEIRSLLTNIALFTYPPHVLENILVRKNIFSDHSSDSKKHLPGQSYNLVFIWFMETYTKLYFLKHCNQIEVSDIEVENNIEKSYTINTVRALKTNNPDWDIQLIIGQDQAEKIDEWKEYEALIKETTICVANRGCKNIKDLKIKFPFITTFEFPMVDLSSSIIRERIKNNESIDSMVPDILDILIRCKEIKQRFEV